ncbi:MAG: hypothetical protein IKU51_02700 [Clostridia bacterium]|nr:hypothetical protein [Clostridia bacterium]
MSWGKNQFNQDSLTWTNVGGTTRKVTNMTAYDDAGNSKNVSISCAVLDAAFCNVDNPHWIIMNTGPCAGWDDTNVSDGGNYPQEMRVDYVRVYKAIED